MQQDIDNAGRSFAIPMHWHLSPHFSLRLSPNRFANSVPARPGKNVRALLNGNGPLGVFPDRDTRNAKARGFFLNAAGISHNHPGVLHQAKKIQVPHRVNQNYSSTAGRLPRGLRIFRPRAKIEAKFLDALPRARVNWKNNGAVASQFLKARENVFEWLSMVDVGRPVQ